MDFNPRARVGRDMFSSFRHTLPLHFNPRARVGRDDSCFSLFREIVISIHAPAWGATCNFPRASSS